MKDIFLSDSERGIDRTKIAANDCGRLQNAPIRGKIPRWWLEEGTTEQIKEWKRQLEAGEATLE
ncbi:MAG: hypothetical protein HZA34_00265 [Candidatus Pacebacteria bacterium]|nr:hypothetical protein [Candidatus Paceibacterota bacterium]